MPRRLRDFWMLAITALVLFALGAQQSQNNRLEQDARVVHHDQQRVEADAHVVATTHLGLLEACNRLQIQRIETNVSNFADFRVFRVVQEGFFHVTVPLDAQARALEAQLTLAIRAKTWTPRTDCARAVNSKGIHFKPPKPIRFVDRMPPPDALTLGPSDFR